MKIEELGLSARAYNVLKRARIDTVEQLQQLSDDDLLCLRNMGVGTVKEIREKVAYVKTMTNGDRMRAMTDEELADFVLNLNFCGIFCTNKKECRELVAADKDIPDEWCKKCFVLYLQEPAEILPPRPNIFEDKQESGLLEE